MPERGKLHWSELVAAVGGIALAIGVFVKAYEARPENPNANIDGMRGTLSIWEVHDILRYVLLAAAIAPIVLLWIIWRQHELSWPRGELTAVIGLTVATLLFYVGVIDRPGEPSGEIELEIGWYICTAGALAMAVGGAIRSTETGKARKPPGIP